MSLDNTWADEQIERLFGKRRVYEFGEMSARVDFTNPTRILVEADEVLCQVKQDLALMKREIERVAVKLKLSRRPRRPSFRF